VEAGSSDAEKLRSFLKESFGWDIREMSGIGVKPISKEGSERLIRAAIVYALKHERESVTLVHKGNIQKFTRVLHEVGLSTREGRIRRRRRHWNDCNGKPGSKLLVKDVIADICFQQSLTRASEFDVIAT